MTTYTVINGTEAQITNVDGSATAVDALTYKDGITLDAAHLASVIALGPGVAVTKDLTANASATQLKRTIAIASLYVST